MMIPADLELLLAPLEDIESIRRKVARLGDRLCDLSYANPYAGVLPSARAAIRNALDDERLLDLQYTPFGGHTLARRAVADDLRARCRLPYRFCHVVLTPGAMAALQVAVHACGEPGDDVIVPVPCWLDYPLYVRAAGRRVVMVPLAPPRFDLNLDAIADALGPRTCAVLLSNPANPTGRCYDARRLGDLGDLLRAAQSRLDRPITLIADETHRDFIDSGAFESLTAYFDRTLIVYSFGKYHFLQGQRLGYVAVSPRHPAGEALAEELCRWLRVLGLATPTALMQRALPALLALRHDLTWLADARARLAGALAAAGYGVVPADGTLFMYVRTPEGCDDMAFAREMAGQGVLVLPAPVFHHRGYFRLALTASASMLECALPVLARASNPGAAGVSARGAP